jgi:hypothetical protein
MWRSDSPAVHRYGVCRRRPITVVVSIGPDIWIRNERRVRRFSRLMFCSALAMLLIPLWVFVAPDSQWHNTVASDLGIGLFALALAAPAVWMARRFARTGLWIGADGIRACNPIGTHTLALRDATAFAPGVLAGGNNGTPCPMLQRSRGPAVGVWALGREGVIWRYDAIWWRWSRSAMS